MLLFSFSEIEDPMMERRAVETSLPNYIATYIHNTYINYIRYNAQTFGSLNCSKSL